MGAAASRRIELSRGSISVFVMGMLQGNTGSARAPLGKIGIALRPSGGLTIGCCQPAAGRPFGPGAKGRWHLGRADRLTERTAGMEGAAGWFPREVRRATLDGDE